MNISGIIVDFHGKIKESGYIPDMDKFLRSEISELLDGLVPEIDIETSVNNPKLKKAIDEIRARVEEAKK